MRALLLLFPASLLLASSAGAQNLPYPPAAMPMSTVQVTASPQAAWVRPDVRQQIAGEYEMSNGWNMRVQTASRHIDATIDEQKPIRLTAIARHKFVSGDGNVRMEFNQGMSGDEMTMSYRPNPSLAQVIVLSSRMAQR